MARKRPSEPDEGQFSLDDFMNQEPASPDSVPDMIDLSEEPQQPVAKPLRTFSMPGRAESVADEPTPPPSSGLFHNLGKRFPNPPIPMNDGGMVLHRATLIDMTGVDTLLDWVSDGHAALVEMARLMNRQQEVTNVLARLHLFVESDMGGQIVQITETRIMLLPPGCVGLNGLEDEAFNDEAERLGGL